MVSSGRQRRQGRSSRGGHALAALCVAVCLATTLATAAKAQTRWELPLSSSGSSVPARQLRSLANLAAELSGQQLQINVHDAGKLMPPAEIKDAVRKGVVPAGEIALALYAGEAPVYGVDTLPFLAMSFAEARKLYALQKPLLDKRLAEEGLVLLASMPFAPLGIFSRKPLTGMSDLNDLRIRAYNTLTKKLALRTSAIPVPVETADLPQAVRSGAIDAFTASPAQAVSRKAAQYAPFFLQMAVWVPRNAIIVNRAAFDAMGSEERKALVDSAAKAEMQAWQQAESETSQFEEKLGATGFSIISPADDFTASVRRIGQAIAADWLKDMGEDGVALLDRLTKP